jgi:septal ring factor EnvC (AmiA/AmiB activator)
MARKAASQYLRDREKEESNYLLKQALTSIFALTQKVRVTIAATIDRYNKTSTPPVMAGALRSDIARQDKLIKNQIDAQQTLLKKNQELAKEAAKLDEKNKKLAEKNKKLEAKNRAFNNEKKTIEAQNADLAKKHDAIKAAEKPIVTTPK